jgi:hypothetical protein
MDAYAIMRRGSEAVRPGATWDAVGGYQYLAPHRVWMDETRESVMAEAARARLLAGAEPASGRRSLVEAVRHRIGAVLVGVGTKLQGANGAGMDTPVATTGGTLPAR